MRTMQMVWALVVAIAAAGTASAGTIVVSDFTAPSFELGTHGGTWSWSTYDVSDPTSRTLTVGPVDTSDYLQQAYGGTPIDIAGATQINLTGSWSGSGTGSFILEFFGGGVTFATSGPISFSAFAGGPTTVHAPITWVNPAPVYPGTSDPITSLTVWDLKGAAYSLETIGYLQLTLFTVSDGAAAVPEIDPASFGSVAAMLASVLALVERRRLRQAAV